MINIFELILRWPIFSALAVIFITLYIYLSRNFNYWTKHGISGPKPVPILGNRISFFVRPMPYVEVEWYRKYGKLYGLYSGSKPVITVAEPELLKQVMVKDFNTFRNRRETPTSHPVISKNLLAARDDDWKRIRAITSPAFTSGKLKKMYSLISECCDDYTTHLEKCANNGEEINLKEVNGAYTLDVIAKCAFATDTKTHTNPDNGFAKNVKAAFNPSAWQMLLLFALPSFISKNPRVRKLIMAGRSSSDFLINAGRHIIRQRKSSGINKNYKDFLQLLIDAEIGGDESNAANGTAIVNSTDKKLTENEILAQCWLFFLAGYDTTASTLTFCLYELAVHPEIQQKLYEEIKSIFGDNGEIDYETLLKLPYLDAVISETLRKYPIAMRVDRQAMDDIELGDTGLIIPKGMMVEIPIYGIHYDPENYDNPSSFVPERFMPENQENIKPYTYLPFGTGPRNCIGMRFALLEAKIALSNIVNKFILFTTKNTDIPLKYNTGRRLLSSKRVIAGIKKRY